MNITINRFARTFAGRFRIGAVTALLLLSQGVGAGPFSINLNFTGGLTAGQQAVFTQAADLWESLLPAYQPGIGVTGLTINASTTFIDGVGGILGQAGPGTAGLRRQGGYWLSTRGTMQFDTADVQKLESDGTFLFVVLHEMAHVIGFGTLWTLNNVYQSGSGRYTGANAVAAARAEVGKPNLTFVPVELGGGPGTANAHWDERDGGVCCTGFTDPQGRDATFELMTGWLNAPAFISQTTIQSFVDIGYVSALSMGIIPQASFNVPGSGVSTAAISEAAVPEPTTYAMLLFGLCVLGFMARRMKASAA
jgi:PEP-CTERM motif/Leishmanolysin